MPALRPPAGSGGDTRTGLGAAGARHAPAGPHGAGGVPLDRAVRRTGDGLRSLPAGPVPALPRRAPPRLPTTGSARPMAMADQPARRKRKTSTPAKHPGATTRAPTGLAGHGLTKAGGSPPARTGGARASPFPVSSNSSQDRCSEALCCTRGRARRTPRRSTRRTAHSAPLRPPRPVAGSLTTLTCELTGITEASVSAGTSPSSIPGGISPCRGRQKHLRRATGSTTPPARTEGALSR